MYWAMISETSIPDVWMLCFSQIHLCCHHHTLVWWRYLILRSIVSYLDKYFFFIWNEDIIFVVAVLVLLGNNRCRCWSTEFNYFLTTMLVAVADSPMDFRFRLSIYWLPMVVASTGEVSTCEVAFFIVLPKVVIIVIILSIRTINCGAFRLNAAFCGTLATRKF